MMESIMVTDFQASITENKNKQPVFLPFRYGSRRVESHSEINLYHSS